MNNDNIRMICDAFITLCDYIEYSDNSCSVCPLREKICFNKNKGTEFWEAIDEIKKELNDKPNTF